MGQKGITLIELIVVMAIAAVIGWILVTTFVNMNESVINQSRTVDLQASGRNAVDGMVRILREAGLDPLGSADAGVEEATATKLRITRDANLNGVIDEEAQETVTFEFADGRLRRCFDEGLAAESCSVISDAVEELTFSYPGAGVPPEPAAIQIIEIELRLRGEKAKQRGDILRGFTTTVQGRNL